jgi:nicotinate phosphoribosyltransferase
MAAASTPPHEGGAGGGERIDYGGCRIDYGGCRIDYSGCRIDYTPGHVGPGGRATRGPAAIDRDRTGSRTGLMGIDRPRPSHEILSGDSADVYFARADSILDAEGLDPVVTMEVFTRREAVLCGIDEAKNLLGHVLAECDPEETQVEALSDGARIGPREVVLRIRARYRRFGLYETALLGMLAQSTGWATAAREIVDIAAPEPVISFGARHVHPDITDVLDYAAIVGGCVGASTPAGARLAGLAPTGTMPHSLVLIFGDTVEAARAFDRHLGPDVPRIVLVDTFKDEAEEALRVAHALGDRLYGIRLDTPSERGRVTAELVHEVRARLDQEGYSHVRIVVSGGLNPDRVRYFKEAGAPVDSYAVGSHISGASPIDFTGDIKEIDGRPIAKRGRIPGITQSPRLEPVDLGQYRRVADPV